MEWVETTGRTVDEAKDAALDQLGVDEHDAEFEVVEEPKVGLFGRLRSEARVRARVMPNVPRPKDDRRRRRSSRGDRPGAAPSGGGAVSDKGPARGATGGGSRQARPSPTQPPRGGIVNQDVTVQEQAEVAKDFLSGLLEALEEPGEVEVRVVDDETAEVAVSGEHLGLLIGPRGSTLQALQDITRTAVQQRTGTRHGRLFVDVGGYRQKRKEALATFTRALAAEVRESGESRALEPMHPADRKVVHDTVNDIDGVRTTSEGEEPRRRVIIEPA